MVEQGTLAVGTFTPPAHVVGSTAGMEDLDREDRIEHIDELDGLGPVAVAVVEVAVAEAPAAAAVRASGMRRGSVARLQRHLGTTGIALLAAIAVLRFHRPPQSLTPRPFQSLFAALPSADAYGTSGELRMRFAMPGDAVRFPLAIQGDPATLSYVWQPVSEGVAPDPARPLAGGALTAPSQPGFYRLALVRGTEIQHVPDVALAVMVPFEAKKGARLEGYLLGMYRGERGRTVAQGVVPDGFVKVDTAAAALPLSKHFQVGDFLSHDGQRQWPRFAAVQPRLIDKLELVIADVAAARGMDPDSVRVNVNVNAGYRSPSHNRNVPLAAQDSRHQYGDAADVAIDANFDGRFSREDSRLVAAAVERVEERHPELAGGMGLYLSGRYTHSYVHIDARGRKARWRG
jgi:hypothetical protein